MFKDSICQCIRTYIHTCDTNTPANIQSMGPTVDARAYEHGHKTLAHKLHCQGLSVPDFWVSSVLCFRKSLGNTHTHTNTKHSTTHVSHQCSSPERPSTTPHTNKHLCLCIHHVHTRARTRNQHTSSCMRKHDMMCVCVRVRGFMQTFLCIWRKYECMCMCMCLCLYTCLHVYIYI